MAIHAVNMDDLPTSFTIHEYPLQLENSAEGWELTFEIAAVHLAVMTRHREFKIDYDRVGVKGTDCWFCVCLRFRNGDYDMLITDGSEYYLAYLSQLSKRRRERRICFDKHAKALIDQTITQWMTEGKIR